MLDEGYPLTMETNMLKDIVLPPSIVRKLLSAAGVSGQVQIWHSCNHPLLTVLHGSTASYEAVQ
jgi:hypothetical protein